MNGQSDIFPSMGITIVEWKTPNTLIERSAKTPKESIMRTKYELETMSQVYSIKLTDAVSFMPIDHELNFGTFDA